MPVLVVLAGRPGTGKTTLARALCQRRPACYLRVDAVETALRRCGVDVFAEGYAVVQELALANLTLGLDVVVDAVNPVPEARSAWPGVAGRAGARLVVVETSLTDPAEHRRRVEGRAPDLPGQVVPTWAQVEDDRWVAWDESRDGSRVVVDTTDSSTALAAVLDLLTPRA